MKWHGSNWIRKEKRHAIYLRDNNECVYCGAIKNLSLDHIIPRSKGGSNKETNLITCCEKCNKSRKDKPLSKFTSQDNINKIRKLRRRKLNKYIERIRNEKFIRLF